MTEHEQQEESPLVEAALEEEKAFRDMALHDYAAAAFASNARGIMRAHGVRPWLRRLLAEELDIVNKLRRGAGRGAV